MQLSAQCIQDALGLGFSFRLTGFLRNFSYRILDNILHGYVYELSLVYDMGLGIKEVVPCLYFQRFNKKTLSSKKITHYRQC